MKNKVPLLCALTGVLMTAGCSVNPAKLQNADNAECRSNLKSALTQILTEEEEKLKSQGAKAALKVVLPVIINGLSNAPYESRNGFGFSLLETNYKFLFEESKGVCVLNLYEKKTGSMTYSNTINYINSKEVASCYCKK